jgi:hypothetical protein
MVQRRQDRVMATAPMAFDTKPIADFFTNVTSVINMFAGIVGFAAWSSVREPSQVFIFLETVYGEYD